MEVLLLRVPSTGEQRFAGDPPISQGLIAAVLWEAGISCEILDLSFEGDSGLNKLLAGLERTDLRVVGMSAFQSNIERCLQIAAIVRRIRSDVRILLGGPQATHMPAIGLREMPMIDGLCRGPGEYALPQYVNALRDAREEVAGWLLRTDSGGFVDSRAALLPEHETFPSPYQCQLWPLDRYNIGVIFASRGCPYNCSFCYTPAISNQHLSLRTEERILRDILMLAEAGVRHVFFADPIFVVQRERCLRLLRDLGNLHTGITFNCETRVEAIDQELLEALSRAGCISISYGLETASSTVLAGVRKNINIKRFKEIVTMTLEHGILVELFCLYGLPGQTADDVRYTFDFIEGWGLAVQAAAALQQLQLYFGIEILRDPSRFGIEIIGKQPAYLSPGLSFRTTTLGPDEFQALESEWSIRFEQARKKFHIPIAGRGASTHHS